MESFIKSKSRHEGDTTLNDPKFSDRQVWAKHVDLIRLLLEEVYNVCHFVCILSVLDTFRYVKTMLFRIY